MNKNLGTSFKMSLCMPKPNNLLYTCHKLETFKKCKYNCDFSGSCNLKDICPYC